MTRGWEIDSYSPMSDDRDCGGALAPSSGGSERNRFGKFGCQVAEAPIRLFFQSNILGPVCLPLPSDIPKWHAPPKVPVAKNTACLGSFNNYVDKEKWVAQMFGPELHVFTLKFLALKTLVFPHRKYFPEFFCFDFCLSLFYATFQRGPQTISKVAHNRPRPFYFKIQPRIDFSYYEISGPGICSLIWGG